MQGLSSTIVSASYRVCFHGEDPSDFTARKQSDDIQLQEAFEELPGERYKVYEQGGPLRHTRDNVGFCAHKVWLWSKDRENDYLKRTQRWGGSGDRLRGIGRVLTTFRLALTKGIFACRRLTESSLCTVEKCSLRLRCSESVTLRGRQTKHRLPAWCKVTKKFCVFPLSLLECIKPNIALGGFMEAASSEITSSKWQ